MAADCSIAEQSFIEKDLCTMFSPEFLRKTAIDTGLIKRERKIDAVIMFWVLTLSFGVRLQRTLASLKRSYMRLRLIAESHYGCQNFVLDSIKGFPTQGLPRSD